MARNARVAIVQFAHDDDDPSVNLAAIHDAVERLRDRDLIVFPELTLHGHHIAAQPPGLLRRALRATPDEEVAQLHALVKRVGTRVVLGALMEQEGRLHNLAIYSDGEQRVSYAKTHVHWSEAFSPGNAFPVVETPLGRLGMLICFDAAFPEVPRILALRGAQIVVNISAIPSEFPLGIVHRRLQACSLENQVYTLFANRRGPGFEGGSAVVDPTGEIVAQAGSDDAVLEATLNLDQLDAWRAREPLFIHRRPELYGELTRASTRNDDGQPATPK